MWIRLDIISLPPHPAPQKTDCGSIIARIIAFNTCVISRNHFPPAFLMNKVETIIEVKSIGTSAILLNLSLPATAAFNILINSTKQIISISREEKMVFYKI